MEKLTFLLIEDEPFLARVVKESLEQLGYLKTGGKKPSWASFKHLIQDLEQAFFSLLGFLTLNTSFPKS